MKQKLILDFTSLSGGAKDAVMEYTQRELFKMGFSWHGGKEVLYKHANFIYVNSSRDKVSWLSYTAGSYPFKPFYSMIFDVTVDLRTFLLEAKKILATPVNVKIEGVDVVITANEINYNYNNLYTRVREKAIAIQKESFRT